MARTAMDELSDDGAFKRTASIWRKWIKKGSDEYPPEKNRYHLYVSYACPWASRCLAVRALKGLENVVSVSVVHPTLLRSRPDDENDQHIGWWFCDGEKQEPVANILGHGSIPAEGATVDHVNGKKFVRDIYEMCKDTHGKSTVPILFDKKTNMIVNNESADIVEMFDKEFQGIGENPDTSIELFPSGRERELEEINSQVYEINDGVYRCGFSTTQQAYNTAVDALYKNLDWAEERLSHSRFLLGDKLSIADIRLFVTLIRFDPVYVQHFKCTRKMLREYPNLFSFTRDVYSRPAVKKTVNFDHITRHYYSSHTKINQFAIIAECSTDFEAPNDRATRKYS
ncbi:Glutathionyl-hydroquinone reductase YqjG [Diplonema papillatum]|nr:Glutathionyl-hydroquinone reductase YqjG [Diplonema papillatum]